MVVVGAGPSGSYSASSCAKRGLRTLLLDRQPFPRDKPCGGILEAKYFDKLAPFMVGAEENITYHTSMFYNFNKIYVRPLKSYIYKRINFDSLLVDFAIESGAEFHDRAKVTSIRQAADHVQITWEKNDNGHGSKMKTKAKLCIGADGINSMVRRCCGLERFRVKHDRLITLLVEAAEPRDDFAWSLTTEKGKPSIGSFFFSGLPGFGWLAPGKDTINVGIGVPVKYSHDLKDRFQKFLTNLHLEHELNNQISSTIPIMPLKQVYSGRIMLVGDAAGMVDPWTGGGINWGIRSSKAASRSAQNVLNGAPSNSTRVDLKCYQDDMKNSLKTLRFKGMMVKFVIWLYNHKLTSPSWEQFILKHAFPNV